MGLTLKVHKLFYFVDLQERKEEEEKKRKEKKSL